MATSILNIALTGLKAAQAGMSVTANNITNADTVGYSRQTLVQNASFSNFSGSGYFGQGVDVVTVTRAYNAFLTAQTTQAASSLSYLDTYSDQMTGLMNRMGTVETGITNSLNTMYEAMSNLGQRPSESAPRQAALTAAQSASARFRSISDDLSSLRNGTNQQISATTVKINELVQSIATYNDKINVAMGATGNGHSPNELLDQREQVLRELGKLTSISFSTQENSVNVNLTSGQPLVVGTVASQFVFQSDANSLAGGTLTLMRSGKETPLRESDLEGGSLGALVQFRDKELNNAQTQLGKIAIAMAAGYNQQQQFGIDAKGAAGTPMFTIGAPLVVPGRSNTGDGSVSISVTDIRSLTGDDYQVTRNGSDYVVTRGSSGAVVGTYDSLPQKFEGLQIGLTSGDMADGDSFTISVAREAASGLQVLINDPNKIATAAPMELKTATANKGTGVIGHLHSVQADTVDYGSSVNVVFTDSSKYELRNNAGAVLGAGALTPPKSEIALNGWSFDMTGTPSAGDTFTVAASPGDPSGDNRNALAMAALSTTKLLDGNTLTDKYASLVAQVGTRASAVNVSKTAQQAAFTQSINEEQSNAGVNTDEEGASLIRYQQAYAAAGKILAMSSQLFDELITSIR